MGITSDSSNDIYRCLKLMVKIMDNESFRKWRLIGLVTILMLLLSSCGRTSDLQEISTDISSHSIVFKSERGFGNDRFDIYSFSLRKPEDISGFQMVSEESEKFFWNYITMIEAELIDDPSKESSLKAVKADIVNATSLCPIDGQYLHVSLNGTSKLYVYSPVLNAGYCLVLVI